MPQNTLRFALRKSSSADARCPEQVPSSDPVAPQHIDFIPTGESSCWVYFNQCYDLRLLGGSRLAGAQFDVFFYVEAAQATTSHTKFYLGRATLDPDGNFMFPSLTMNEIIEGVKGLGDVSPLLCVTDPRQFGGDQACLYDATNFVNLNIEIFPLNGVDEVFHTASWLVSPVSGAFFYRYQCRADMRQFAMDVANAAYQTGLAVVEGELLGEPAPAPIPRELPGTTRPQYAQPVAGRDTISF